MRLREKKGAYCVSPLGPSTLLRIGKEIRIQGRANQQEEPSPSPLRKRAVCAEGKHLSLRRIRNILRLGKEQYAPTKKGSMSFCPS